MLKLMNCNYKQLKKDGWYILTVWECALKGKTKLPFYKLIEDISNWLEFSVRDKVIKGKNV